MSFLRGCGECRKEIQTEKSIVFTEECGVCSEEVWRSSDWLKQILLLLLLIFQLCLLLENFTVYNYNS